MRAAASYTVEGKSLWYGAHPDIKGIGALSRHQPNRLGG
jgi:hypothetical protein